MSGSVEGGITPNLTPMLDMVFQLITFFVIIFNCQQSDLAAGVDLPVIGTAKPLHAKDNTSERVIVWNFRFADPDPNKPLNEKPSKRSWEKQIWVMGAVIPEDKIENVAAAEANSGRMKAGLTDSELLDGKLKDIIVIRADKQFPFRTINQVIKACQTSGFRRFSFKADNAPAAAPQP
jgi:biopolymer transport protein ExbD